MRKYNLSKIMKRAWELVKSSELTMSAALKKAWMEAKNEGSIENLIERYRISPYGDKIKISFADLAKNENMMDTIKESKPFIMDYFRQKKEAERKAAEAREAKIKAIEGLDEILELRYAWDEWHADFNKMMETGSGIMTVARPAANEKELREKYPRANAYLIAYAESHKSNYDISAIGEKALERIINGEDYTKVLCDMDEDFKAFTSRHFWD